MTAKDIIKKSKEDNVKFFQLQFTDLFGLVKSLTIPFKILEEALQYGIWFDGSSIEGFARIAESDMYLKPDLSTYAIIPWLTSEDGNTARFICDVYNPDGSHFEGDPRYILQKALKRARKMGYEYKTGTEMEFFLFSKKQDEIAFPQDEGGYFDMTADKAYEIRRDMTVALQKFGIDVETTHHEVSSGQHEIDFKYDNALITADAATTIRFVLKAVAQKYDLCATFMPKPISELNGNGMHVHQSLFDIKTNKNSFYSKDNKYSLSDLAYNFIAGQLEHVMAMSSILNPIINSYKRLIPGYEAPVYLSWGHKNRSSLIRVPKHFKGKSKSTRIELRSPDPSCNIYLAFAVMLEAGLDGIRKDLKPPAPVEDDVYNYDKIRLQKEKIKTLPGSLKIALDKLKEDSLIQKALGKHTYYKYLAVKEQEWDHFRMQVTNWELERYLEKY
ncbi:MAG: type I glutamate--ammonia ligase [Candidatus Cloacimonetes bacterium]|nr:type I glutamate--ammonia ligase [Candidatus Cloacimonadota bacterium]MBS3767033.1 type I glutamate--ammonia ligase [Candidatus Cloacimonadota bacterium]